MPYIVFSDGSVRGWAPSVGGYVDTGYILPALEGGKHLPGNGDPVIPEPKIATEATPGQKPTLKPDDTDPYDKPENEGTQEGVLEDPKSFKLQWNKQPYVGTNCSDISTDWFSALTAQIFQRIGFPHIYQFQKNCKRDLIRLNKKHLRSS